MPGVDWVGVSGVSAGAPVEGGVPLRVKVLEKVRDFSRAAVVA
jgi:hypothetical protein